MAPVLPSDFNFAEAPFNITNIQIAALQAGGTYATAIAIKAGNQFTIKPVSKQISLSGYGKTKEIATIMMEADIDLDHGGMDYDALEVALSVARVDTGTTPNIQSDLDVAAGGEGLGYIGVIGDVAGLLGSNIAIGLPKVKLVNAPEFAIQENEFVTGKVSGKAIEFGGRLWRFRRNETAVDSDFATFFS